MVSLDSHSESQPQGSSTKAFHASTACLVLVFGNSRSMMMWTRITNLHLVDQTPLSRPSSKQTSGNTHLTRSKIQDPRRDKLSLKSMELNSKSVARFLGSTSTISLPLTRGKHSLQTRSQSNLEEEVHPSKPDCETDAEPTTSASTSQPVYSEETVPAHGVTGP